MFIENKLFLTKKDPTIKCMSSAQITQKIDGCVINASQHTAHH